MPVSNASISEEVLQRYHAIFERLLLMREEGQQCRLLKLAPEAEETFFKWAQRHREERQHQSVSPIFKGVCSKLIGYAGRFSLILHCLREAAGEVEGTEVDSSTVHRAFELVDYFKRQSRQILDRMGSAKSDDRLERVLSWMQSRGAIFRLRDCQRSGVAGVKSAADARLIFLQLEMKRYGVIIPGQRGRVLFALRKEYVIFETAELAKLHDHSDVMIWLSNNCYGPQREERRLEIRDAIFISSASNYDPIASLSTPFILVEIDSAYGALRFLYCHAELM